MAKIIYCQECFKENELLALWKFPDNKYTRAEQEFLAINCSVPELKKQFKAKRIMVCLKCREFYFQERGVY